MLKEESERYAMVISENMADLVKNSSAIRALFEEGKAMAKVVGAENVYDFSLGNPSIPAPLSIKAAILDILDNEDSRYVHGYMSNAGYEPVRQAVADDLNEKYGAAYDMDDIVMTVGAAGGLNCVLRALLNENDEVICFAPFFGEYRSYTSNFKGKLVVVPADTKDFQLNLEALPTLITERTKVLIINNPNNPSGVIYSAETLKRLQSVLEEAERKIGHPIYVVSDEPYRELVYDGNTVPFMPGIIKNCVICYSFSKSLSLPGERIGYLALSKNMDAYDELQPALVVANRCLGFVNAPSLMQLAVSKCLKEKTDVAAYDKNRKLLYNRLTALGFECVKPQGAFYLFVKSPLENEAEFVSAAKKYHLLLVGASSFGCPGYVRIAYCVAYDMIEKSLPAFEALAREMGLCLEK